MFFIALIVLYCANVFYHAFSPAPLLKPLLVLIGNKLPKVDLTMLIVVPI